MPSDSGEKLSASTRGMPISDGALDQRRNVLDAELADLELIEAADHQAAHAAFADAGADREAGRRHAGAFGGAAADDGHFGAGVEDEIDDVAAVDASFHDDLLALDAERHGERLVGDVVGDLERRAAAERFEELDLRARERDAIALLVGEEERHRFAERGGGFVEAVQAFEDEGAREARLDFARRADGSPRRL